MDIKKRKNEMRKHVWDELENKSIATFPRPVHGRIPNFRGVDAAARKLTELDEFKKAKTILTKMPVLRELKEKYC